MDSLQIILLLLLFSVRYIKSSQGVTKTSTPTPTPTPTNTTTTTPAKPLITWHRTLHTRHTHEMLESVGSEHGNSFLYLCGWTQGPRDTHASYYSGLSNVLNEPGESVPTLSTQYTDGMLVKVAVDSGEVLWSKRLQSSDLTLKTTVHVAAISMHLRTVYVVVTTSILETGEPLSVHLHALETHTGDSRAKRVLIKGMKNAHDIVSTYAGVYVCMTSKEDKAIVSRQGVGSKIRKREWRVSLNEDSNVKTGCQDIIVSRPPDTQWRDDAIYAATAGGYIHRLYYENGSVSWHTKIAEGSVNDVQVSLGPTSTGAIYVAWTGRVVSEDGRTTSAVVKVTKMTSGYGSILWTRHVMLHEVNLERLSSGAHVISTFVKGSLYAGHDDESGNDDEKKIRLFIWNWYKTKKTGEKELYAVCITPYNDVMKVEKVEHMDSVITDQTIAASIVWGTEEALLYGQVKQGEGTGLALVKYEGASEPSDNGPRKMGTIVEVHVTVKISLTCQATGRQVGDVLTELLRGRLTETRVIEKVEEKEARIAILTNSEASGLHGDDPVASIAAKVQGLFVSNKEVGTSEMERGVGCEKGGVTKVSEGVETVSGDEELLGGGGSGNKRRTSKRDGSSTSSSSSSSSSSSPRGRRRLSINKWVILLVMVVGIVVMWVVIMRWRRHRRQQMWEGADDAM